MIQEHAGFQVIDHALINKTPLPEKLLSRYREDGAEVTRYNLDAIQAMGVNPVELDLLSSDTYKIRHDPGKLARSILNLFQ